MTEENTFEQNSVYELKMEMRTLTFYFDSKYFVISGYWQVLISKKMCLKYYKNFNKDPENGFYQSEDECWLKHKDSQLALTTYEMNKLKEAIKIAFSLE